MGRAGGRGPGGRLGELSARGASLVAEAHQWTRLRGKLALGAVRGPRHRVRGPGLRAPPVCEVGHLPLSAAARSAPTAGAVVPGDLGAVVSRMGMRVH